MKKILISYADDNMAYSLQRLGREAERLGIFDKILLYTAEDIPISVKKSPLLNYRRGGGYWVWKPALIWETLQKYGDDYFIVYLDAGCSVKKSHLWEEYFEVLYKYDTLCFKYKNEMFEWDKFGQTSTLIKYWTKDSTILFFQNYMGYDYESRHNKVFGGALFVKGKNNVFVKEWLDITIKYPELISDPTDKELIEGNKELAFHKHDQSIITPLAYFFHDSVLVLEEKCETYSDGAIIASRIRAKTKLDFMKLELKRYLRVFLGANFYSRLKKIIKSS